jgi:hypothetical protein
MTHNLRDISSFNKEEMDSFLASFDTVLSDCDGEFAIYLLHVVSYSISTRVRVRVRVYLHSIDPSLGKAKGCRTCHITNTEVFFTYRYA